MKTRPVRRVALLTLAALVGCLKNEDAEDRDLSSPPQNRLHQLCATRDSNHQEILELLRAGFDLHSPADMDFEELGLSLDLHGDGSSVPRGGPMTPLSLAAIFGDAARVRVLLDAGAEVEADESFGGLRALHFAVWRNGDTEVARELLRAGASATRPSRAGLTPLHLAAENWNEEATALLLAEGAEVDAQDDRGERPLHRAAHDDRLGAMQLLLEAEAGLLGEDRAGHSVVDHARRNDSPGAVLLALEELRGLLNETEGRWGWTSTMHLAVEQERLDLLPLLIDAEGLTGGSHLRSLNGRGFTPIHEAASYGSADVVSFLLEATSAGSGSSPLVLARTKQARGYVVVGGPNEPLELLPLHCARRSPEITRMLLDAGAPVDGTDRIGRTALHVAVSPGVVRVLLDAGASVEVADERGWTALHHAVYGNSLEHFCAILEAGADPNALDLEGRGPLAHARDHGPPQFVAALEQAGAK